MILAMAEMGYTSDERFVLSAAMLALLDQWEECPDGTHRPQPQTQTQTQEAGAT
jgi:hypothetical protein